MGINNQIFSPIMSLSDGEEFLHLKIKNAFVKSQMSASENFGWFLGRKFPYRQIGLTFYPSGIGTFFFCLDGSNGKHYSYYPKFLKERKEKKYYQQHLEDSLIFGSDTNSNFNKVRKSW